VLVPTDESSDSSVMVVSVVEYPAPISTLLLSVSTVSSGLFDASSTWRAVDETLLLCTINDELK
jgi:hypothetical protein